MAKVHQDVFGLYVYAGGYVARPLKLENPSQFKAGYKVSVHHFAGSTRAGVGKDKSCGRGEYLETWTTTGIRWGDYRTISQQQMADLIEFYRNDHN